MAIVWYVDDLKFLHTNVQVINQQVQLLNDEFGKEMELTI
jgi:hypothetical protein